MPVQMPTVNLSIRPLAQVRAAAKPGTIGHLNALRLIHNNPNTAYPIRIFLGKIAQGEIIFPPALLTNALLILQDLSQHEKVDIHAQAAYKVVAVETLIQARHHEILRSDAQIIIQDICTHKLVLHPELIDEAVAAIRLLPATDASHGLALQMLKPAPTAPAITPPAQPAPKPSPSHDTGIVTPTVTSSQPAPFTIKVANNNGGKTYVYQTYPHTDYRPLMADGVKFSDLDQMALDRQKLETSLGAMWCALSALGSRKTHVSRWLADIKEKVDAVTTAYAEKVRILEQARALTVAYLIEANQITSEADAKIAEISRPDKKDNETQPQWRRRLRNARDTIWDIETQAIQELEQNESRLSVKLQELGLENQTQAIIRLGTIPTAEDYFERLISSFSTELSIRVSQIEQQPHEKAGLNKAQLEAELVDIQQKLDLVNSHRRPAIQQLENLRQISAEIRSRITPRLDTMEAVPFVPEEGETAAAEEPILKNWPRPPLAGAPNQAEIDRLTARVVELEEQLVQARKLADYIVGRSGSNDQFIVVENGTKYAVGDKVMGGEVKFLYTWEGKNLAIVVSPIPMRTPEEIEKELRKTKNRLAKLQRENEALKQRAAATEETTAQPGQENDTVNHLFEVLTEKGLAISEFFQAIDAVASPTLKRRAAKLIAKLLELEISPGTLINNIVLVKSAGLVYQEKLLTIAEAIVEKFSKERIRANLVVLSYYRNILKSAPFILEKIFDLIIKLINEGKDPFNTISNACLQLSIAASNFGTERERRLAAELDALFHAGKAPSQELEALLRQSPRLLNPGEREGAQ